MREAANVVQPTVAISPAVRHTCRPWHGARAWTAYAAAHTVETILPDLSCDVLLDDGRRPHLIPRSATALTVPLDPRTPVRGLRLPVAATEVTLDAAWPGWRGRHARDDDPTEIWEAARTAGALAWAIDPERETLLRLLDVPGARVSDAATALCRSERTLRRQSVGWFGVSPVSLRGLLRNWRFLRELDRGSSATVAAATVGFADVAHSSRELKRFAGGSSGWLRARLAD